MSTLETLFSHPFTLGNARECGLRRPRLAALVKSREIRRVLHGVYVHKQVADTIETRLAALKLVMPAHVVVRGRTAAWLYGIDVFRFAELDELPPLETCVPPTKNRLRHPAVRGSRRELMPVDVVHLDGLLVTTPVRTALDLGASLRRREALATLDQFMRAELVDRDELNVELPRFARRRGVIQLRELVALADARAESTAESWTRLTIIDADLPHPEPQWIIEANGRELFRLDLAFPRHRVCVEYDGEEFHDSDEARAYDLARRQWLEEHGWIVIVVRKADFTPEAIARWTQQLRNALRSRLV